MKWQRERKKGRVHGSKIRSGSLSFPVGERNGIGVGDRSVSTDIFYGGTGWRNADTHMARATKDCPLHVTVFSGGPGSPAVSGSAGLGTLLIHDTVQVLLGIEMIVAMKNDVHVVLP